MTMHAALPEVDPVCLVHGQRLSQHNCLYCCLCFKHLEQDACNVTAAGTRENVCLECAAAEALRGRDHPAYLFLDFDGVIRLRGEDGVERFEPSRIRQLNLVLSATGATLVVVSNHRKHKSPAELHDALETAGVVALPHTNVQVADPARNRADAVLAFLRDAPGHVTWAVADDEMRHYDLWSSPRRERVVCPSSRTGLTDRSRARLISLLNNTPLQPELQETSDDDL